MNPPAIIYYLAVKYLAFDDCSTWKNNTQLVSLVVGSPVY
jgi:hypothetical protein